MSNANTEARVRVAAGILAGITDRREATAVCLGLAVGAAREGGMSESDFVKLARGIYANAELRAQFVTLVGNERGRE